MKSLRASSSDESRHNPIPNRSQHQNVKSSNNYNPKEVSITVTNQTVSSNPTSNPTKKHGLGFRRFSLRRLFNPSSIGRTVGTKHRSTKDNHSESGSATETKGATNLKSGSHRPTCSSYDAESYSISSGRSEYFNPTLPSFNDNNICSSGAMECPLCLLEQPFSNFPELSTCAHRACHHCLQQYLKIEILESRININCPECVEPLHPNDIQRILNFDSNLMEKYETFMLRRILVTEPDARWCPAPDCGYCVIASGCASCPKLKCERPGCETSFCYHCKQEWHPNQTCDAARAQRGLRHSAHGKSSVSFSHDSIVQRDDIKPCPCCKVLIIKMDDGSCNHMTCSVCGTEFCWLCMKEISDLHYLSPSGCTFWGKKPWSRKKKIMWQLGMLVGAPVGIALIAGIAVPAIIIGIPVWVGRKLHARFEKNQMSRHKRNVLVTTGVLTSIFVSPILAAVAVGIGVPILLAYVYGVVPISLCRSGGCGVITSASGVRIELDEENEIGIGSNVAADGVSVDTALSNRGVNPSIGEVSLGLSTSLSMGSGSHLDRVGCDRENSSTAACAGSIASGTLSTAHKVEIQADVSSNKRFSLSSHCETTSATLSFGERSANLSFMDDASVKALAGSITGYKEAVIGYNCSDSYTPVEVHVDASTLSNGLDIEPNASSYSTSPDLLATNYEHSTKLINETHFPLNANYSDYNERHVSYIDETTSPYDPYTTRALKESYNSQNISQTKHLIGKFESRSLEHLNNYCELCHKSHKPCCPNYVSSHQSNKPTAQSTNCVERRQQSKSNDTEEQRRPNKRSNYGNRRRTSSTKSRQLGAGSANQCQKELKRVHSSDCDITDTRIKHSLAFNSTPTSTQTVNELSAQTAQDHNNTDHNTRAYNKNSFSKYFMQKKSIQEMTTKSDNKSNKYLTIDVNNENLYSNDISLKTSEV